MTVEHDSAHPVKKCGSCQRAWPTWDSFILDPNVRLLGLQAVITHPDVNLLVFEHGCGSSISILAKRLRHLLPESESPEPTASLRDTDQCRGHCRLLADLEMCDAPCVNSRDREHLLGHTSGIADYFEGIANTGNRGKIKSFIDEVLTQPDHQ